MEPNVFISYKSEEYHYADRVRFSLEQSGVPCWMAPESIGGGSSYAAEIPKAIRNCKIFVLILTEKSQDSQWVKRELDRAINEKKLIMPFIPEKMTFSDDITFYLTNVQQFFAYRDWDRELDRMINQICAELGIQRKAPVTVETLQAVQPVQTVQAVQAVRTAKAKKPEKKRINTPNPAKKPGKKKKLLIALLSAVAAIAVSAGVTAGVYFSNTVEICNHRYNKGISKLSLIDEYISPKSLDTIALLDNLSTLNLQKCRFDANIKSLSGISLRQISDLTVSECGLTDSLLNSLNTSNSKVTRLDISGNTSVENPAAIKSMSKLDTLILDGDPVRSLDFLENCIYLQSLSAKGCQLTDISGLSNATLLNTVNLGKNGLTSISGTENSADRIERLYLSGNKLTSVDFLKGMSNLKWLDISDNEIGDLSPMYGDDNIRGFDAANNKINKLDADQLSKNLVYVDLSFNTLEQLDGVLTYNTKYYNACLNLEGNSELASLAFKNADGKFWAVNLKDCAVENLSYLYGCEAIRTLVIDYRDDLDFELLKNNTDILYLIDCPLVAQVSTRSSLNGVSLELTTSEEYSSNEAMRFESYADKDIRSGVKGG